MAEVKVSKQTGQEQQSGEERHPARSGESRGLSRRGEMLPSLFSFSPGEFFSTSPFSLMRRFSEEMDRMFSNSRLFGGQRGEENALWMPAVEVSEKDGNMRVCAELPGLTQNDVKVEVLEGDLIIQGQKKREHEEEREGVYHSERSYGQFYRRIPLPTDAKIDDAKAEFRNGILEVTVPVPESARKGRQIPIRTTEGREQGAQAGQTGRSAA